MNHGRWMLLLALGACAHDAGQRAQGRAAAVAGAELAREAAALEERLAGRSAADPGRVDDLLRLAQLRHQQGRDDWAQALPAAQRAMVGCLPDLDCDRLALAAAAPPPRARFEEAEAHYVDFLRTSPQHDRAHDARFELAQIALDLGDSVKAVKLMMTLIKAHPESAHHHLAYVQLGDFYFANNNAYKALLAYKKAGAYPGGERLAYATYMLSWCYYNVSEFALARDTMALSVSMSERARGEATGPDPHHERLADAGLRDLAMMRAEAGGARTNPSGSSP